MAARAFSPAFVLIGAATIAVVATAAVWLAGAPPADVRLVAGRAVIDGLPAEPTTVVAEGARIETMPDGWAEVRVRRSPVRLDAATSARVVDATQAPRRLALEGGRLRVEAASTAVAVAIDATEVVIDEATAEVERQANGLARVVVTRGRVRLAGHGRDLVAPLGTQCAIYPGIGPGTPHTADVSAAFREALEAVDTLQTTAFRRMIGFDVLLLEARPDDALTLVSLLARVDAAERRKLVDRLGVLSPAPPGVVVDAVLNGDSVMIEAWRQRLLDRP